MNMWIHQTISVWIRSWSLVGLRLPYSRTSIGGICCQTVTACLYSVVGYHLNETDSVMNVMHFFNWLSVMNIMHFIAYKVRRLIIFFLTDIHDCLSWWESPVTRSRCSPSIMVIGFCSDAFTSREHVLCTIQHSTAAQLLHVCWLVMLNLQSS